MVLHHGVYGCSRILGFMYTCASSHLSARKDAAQGHHPACHQQQHHKQSHQAKHHLAWSIHDQQNPAACCACWAHPRYSRDKARLGDTLEVIKFVCKDFWQVVFKKQVDNLKTNHRVRAAACSMSSMAGNQWMHHGRLPGG